MDIALAHPDEINISDLGQQKSSLATVGNDKVLDQAAFVYPGVHCKGFVLHKEGLLRIIFKRIGEMAVNGPGEVIGIVRTYDAYEQYIFEEFSFEQPVVEDVFFCAHRQSNV